MARDDLLPFDNLDGDIVQRTSQSAPNLETSFVNPGQEPYYTYLDATYAGDASKAAILEASGEKHHVIPSQTFKNSDLLLRLSTTKLDGVALFDPTRFETNGIWLPSTDDDAVRLGAAKHKGGEDNHSKTGQYNEFMTDKIDKIAIDAEARTQALVLEGMSADEARIRADIEAAKDIRGLQEWVKDKLVTKEGDAAPRLFVNDGDPHGADRSLFSVSLDEIKGSSEFQAGRNGGFIADVRVGDFRVRTNKTGLNLTSKEQADVLLRDMIVKTLKTPAERLAAINSQEFRDARALVEVQIDKYSGADPDKVIRTLKDFSQHPELRAREASIHIELMRKIESINPNIVAVLKNAALGDYANILDAWERYKAGEFHKYGATSAFAIGATLAGLLMVGLTVYAAHEKAGGFNQKFLEEITPSPANILTGVLIGGALFVLAVYGGTVGGAIALTTGTVLGWKGLEHVLGEIQNFSGNELVKDIASSALSVMKFFDTIFYELLGIKPAAGAEIDQFYAANGDSGALAVEPGPGWLIGDDGAVLIGNVADDVIIHHGRGVGLGL